MDANEAYEEAAQIAEAEPEFPGFMPLGLYVRTVFLAIFYPTLGPRVACRATKKAIARKIRAKIVH